MKRIYTTLALLGALATGAFAQRHVDVGAVMLSPSTGFGNDTLNLNCNRANTDSIRETVIVINYGPDVLYPTDTVLIGSPVTSGLNSYYAAYGDTVQVNDTVAILDRNVSISQINWFAQVDGNNNFVEVDKADFTDGQYYLWMNLIQLSGYAAANANAVDTDAANDQGAIALVQYTCTGTGIKDALKNGANLTVFPNPANNQISFNYNFLAATEASLRITDIAGRVVKTLDLGKQNVGNRTFHVDISALNNGMYFLELATNTTKSISKFTKN